MTEEQQNQQQPEQPVQTQKSSDDKTWAIFCHLSALFFGFVGPLVIWLIKRDESPLVNETAKESLNFQLWMLIYFMGAGILTMVVIGALLIPVLIITNFILIVIATVKTSNGEKYTYPLVFNRFIK